MGTICNNGECCGNEYFLSTPKLSDQDELNYNDKLLEYKNGNSQICSSKLGINITSNKKQQIIVIIVAGKSLIENEIVYNDHTEYQISKFYVVEQMKITAKELRPKAILQAISNSNKNYSFLHNGFSLFLKGDGSFLYKRMRIIDGDSSEMLLAGNLYYLFADNYNDMLIENNDSGGVMNSPDLKKLRFSWKKPRQESKSKSNSFINDHTTGSDLSESSLINNQKKINISSVNDRKTKCSIISSMYTIKEVDSFNTSAFNVTLNTNNIGSAPYTNNNSILHTNN